MPRRPRCWSPARIVSRPWRSPAHAGARPPGRRRPRCPRGPCGSPSFRRRSAPGVSSGHRLKSPSSRALASLLVLASAEELILGHAGQVVFFVLQVLLDQVVARRLQEFALFHRRQLLAALHRDLTPLEAGVRHLACQQLDRPYGVVLPGITYWIRSGSQLESVMAT